MTYFLQVVVLAAYTETLLRVSTTARLGILGTEDDIFPLVHTGIGEHQCGVVLDDHRCRGYDGVTLFSEKLLEAFANFVGCTHTL